MLLKKNFKHGYDKNSEQKNVIFKQNKVKQIINIIIFYSKAKTS